MPPRKILRTDEANGVTEAPAVVQPIPAAETEPMAQKALAFSKKYGIILGIIVVLVLVGYFLQQNMRLSSQLKKMQQTGQSAGLDENAKLIDTIGKLIVLPSNEQPTIATVTDLAKLAQQPFFAHASIGDKVLIYTKAKKAILYNPGSNKIVEVAPLNTEAGTPTTSTPTATTTSTKSK